MKTVNIITQETVIPDRIGATLNPTWEQYQAVGWRYKQEIPVLAAGYERSPITWIEGDGTTAMAIYQDRLTSEIEIEQTEIVLAAEAVRQSAKSDLLKHTENKYLDICQQLTGMRVKLGFAELEEIIGQLMLTDKDLAVALTLKLLTLDAAGKRYGGLNWWDDIVWHEEIVP